MEKSVKNPDWRTKLDSLLGVATIFLIVATAVMGVDFFNRLKENRFIGQDPEGRAEIVVTGRAEKFVRPDLAVLNFGVKTESETAAQAMSDNSALINRVIRALKEDVGLAEENLKTVYFNISPRYEWREGEGRSTGERLLVGYEAEQTLEVRIRDLDKVSLAIEKASLQGANQIGGLRFAVEDEDSVRESIREEAIAQARDRAEVLAEQLGVRLVRIVGFREDTPTIPWARSAMMESFDAAAGPDIQPGENKVEINVSITYKID